MSADEPRAPTILALESEDGARFLAEASTALAGSLDYKLTLARVAELAVPCLADWCAIDVVDAEPGQSLREEFLSFASHELRTPLTAVMLVVRMLQSLPAEASREQMASKLSIAG